MAPGETASTATACPNCRRLERRIEELERRNRELAAQLEEARRAAKRQAAPFSKGPPKKNPKKPGRKSGHPPAHRPVPERVDRVVDVPLPHGPLCPHCEGTLTDLRVDPQYQEDIPADVATVVTRFDIHSGWCAHCRRRVRGRSPEQTSDATGAAAVQIGPRTVALAAEMKHERGIPYRKIEQLLIAGFRLRVCPGGIVRATQRLADRAGPLYSDLIAQVRRAAAVEADETGWKIGGENAWLWDFVTSDATLYVIDYTRAHEIPATILGADFAGVLVTDCFLAYDPLPYGKQKDLGHLLRALSEIEEAKTRAGVIWPRKVKQLLKRAMALKERQARMSARGAAIARGRIEASVDRLLSSRLTDPDCARFRERLLKHRDHLFTFLYDPAVGPTSNGAEREIRPAVVIRKISGGSRTMRGAETHMTVASVLRTWRRRGEDPLALATGLLRAPRGASGPQRFLAGPGPPK